MSKRAATAILLAGGQSTRMGTDKARLPWGDTTLLQHIHAQLSAHFDEVLLASGTPDRYADLGLIGIADSPLAEGPMAGILAGLQAARYELVYLHPCDTPELSAELLGRFFGALTDTLAGVHARCGSADQALVGLYRRVPLEATLRASAARGKHGIHAAVAQLHVAKIETDDLRNLNRPEDLSA